MPRDYKIERDAVIRRWYGGITKQVGEPNPDEKAP